MANSHDLPIDEQVWCLRLAGNGYLMISRRTGLPVAEIKAIIEARQALQEQQTAGVTHQAAKARELARLDQFDQRLAVVTDWVPEASRGRSPPTHNEMIRAVRARVMVSQHRSKLRGLYTPQEVNHHHSGTITHVHDVQALAGLLAQLPDEHFAALQAAEVAFSQLEDGQIDDTLTASAH